MALDHSLRPDQLLLDPGRNEAACGCEDHDRFAGEFADTLDERTIRYVLERGRISSSCARRLARSPACWCWQPPGPRP